jgi:hypothetical protein
MGWGEWVVKKAISGPYQITNSFINRDEMQRSGEVSVVIAVLQARNRRYVCSSRQLDALYSCVRKEVCRDREIGQGNTLPGRHEQNPLACLGRAIVCCVKNIIFDLVAAKKLSIEHHKSIKSYFKARRAARMNFTTPEATVFPFNACSRIPPTFSKRKYIGR